MVADNPGTWLFHCHVAEHMTEGMFARLIVHPGGVPAPGRAFFGMTNAQQSMVIRRAQLAMKVGADNAPSCELRVVGSVAVYQALSVFTQQFKIQVGVKSLTFSLDRRGEIALSEGKFKVTNVSPYGVVYGGTMEFEATLSGPTWLRELIELGLTTAPPSPGVPSATIQLDVGGAHHAATTAIKLQAP